MSYLKVYYPNYFYANILSNVIGSEKKTANMIDEAKHQKLIFYHLILMKVIGSIKLLHKEYICR